MANTVFLAKSDNKGLQKLNPRRFFHIDLTPNQPIQSVIKLAYRLFQMHDPGRDYSKGKFYLDGKALNNSKRIRHYKIKDDSELLFVP